LGVEAGFLEPGGAVSEPAVLGHAENEEFFDGVGGFFVFEKVGEEEVVVGLVFAGEDAEGFGTGIQTVDGAVLRDGGFALGGDRAAGMLGVGAVSGDLSFG
jgi:hypothetical protein